MNIVKVVNNEAVTDTPTLAEGTGNQHEAVIKLVRTYQGDLEEFGRVGFEIVPFETAGGAQSREIAILNEPQSTLLLTYMRNLPRVRDFKKRLVKAFFAMADQLRQPVLDPSRILSDPAAMRGLLLTYTEKVIALQDTIKEQAPKVAALDLIATRSEGSLCITDAAKALQVKPKSVLFPYLSGVARWIYRRAGGKSWLGYQDKVQQGLLEHKVTTVKRDDGTEKVLEQVLITPKGLARLANVFSAEVSA
jgi:phage antirepressor YoqD-like protein